MTPRRVPQQVAVEPAVHDVLQGLILVLSGVLSMTSRGSRADMARPQEVSELNRSMTRTKTAAMLADAALAPCYKEEPRHADAG